MASWNQEKKAQAARSARLREIKRLEREEYENSPQHNLDQLRTRAAVAEETWWQAYYREETPGQRSAREARDHARQVADNEANRMRNAADAARHEARYQD